LCRTAESAVHKNRIKTLLLTQQAGVTSEHVVSATALKLSEEVHLVDERELKADKRELAVAVQEAKSAAEELVRTAKLDDDRAITELRLAFERETRELTALYDDKMTRLRDELARARKVDIRGIERRKTRHIQQLIASHEKAYSVIKLYFNEITHSNLDLIKSLNEEVEELKKKESSDEKVMYAIAQENKKARPAPRCPPPPHATHVPAYPCADVGAHAESAGRGAAAKGGPRGVPKRHKRPARDEGK